MALVTTLTVTAHKGEVELGHLTTKRLSFDFEAVTEGTRHQLKNRLSFIRYVKEGNNRSISHWLSSLLGGNESKIYFTYDNLIQQMVKIMEEHGEAEIGFDDFTVNIKVQRIVD